MTFNLATMAADIDVVSQRCTLMEKNMGPISASHSGSTAVTHCMYSLVVYTSSW